MAMLWVSNQGMRPRNEDAACALECEAGYVLAVADGLGGHENGDLASKAAIEVVEQVHKTNPTLPYPALFALAHEAALRAEGQTTLTVARISKTRITVAWIGDSGAFVVRGPDAPAEMMTYPHGRGHILLKSLGAPHTDSRGQRVFITPGAVTPRNVFPPDIVPSTSKVENAQGTLLAVYSDGFDGLYDPEGDLAAEFTGEFPYERVSSPHALPQVRPSPGAQLLYTAVRGKKRKLPDILVGETVSAINGGSTDNCTLAVYYRSR